MIQEGEIIQCPECEADLLRVKQPVLRSEKLRAEMVEQLPLEGVTGQWLFFGCGLKCPICTAPFASESLWGETLIHIKVRGWV